MFAIVFHLHGLSSSVQLGGWSSQGLRLTGSWQEGSSHVVCESTHLTSFAMLVDYSGIVAVSLPLCPVNLHVLIFSDTTYPASYFYYSLFSINLFSLCIPVDSIISPCILAQSFPSCTHFSFCLALLMDHPSIFTYYLFSISPSYPLPLPIFPFIPSTSNFV